MNIKYLGLLLSSPAQFKNLIKRYTYVRIASRFLNFHKSVYPSSITWAITGKCNYRCTYCGVRNYYMGSGIKPDLNYKQIKKIIDNMKKYPVKILLMGGEPLVRKDIFRIMAYLRKSKIKFSLFTNAGLINEKNVDNILDSGAEGISISFDGKGHSDTSGVKGALDFTLKGISLLSKRKLERKLSEPRIRLVTTLTPGFGDDDYEYLLEIAEKYKGIDEINLNNLIFDGKDCGTRKLTIDNDFLKKFDISKIEKWYEKGKTTFTPKRLQKEDIKNWYSFKPPSRESSCIAPYNIGMLLPLGQLTQCFFLDRPLGNLLENSIEKIWDSKEAISVRKRIKNKNFEKECFRCCLLEPRFD